MLKLQGCLTLFEVICPYRVIFEFTRVLSNFCVRMGVDPMIEPPAKWLWILFRIGGRWHEGMYSVSPNCS